MIGVFIASSVIVVIGIVFLVGYYKNNRKMRQTAFLAFVFLFLITSACYAIWMVFFVYGVDTAKDGLGSVHENLIARRLFAIEFWIILSLTVYVIMSMVPRIQLTLNCELPQTKENARSTDAVQAPGRNSPEMQVASEEK